MIFPLYNLSIKLLIDNIFMIVNLLQVSTKICKHLLEAANHNPKVAEFNEYMKNHFTDVKKAYDELVDTYMGAVAHDMAKTMQCKLVAAAHQGGLVNGKGVSVPQPVLDSIETFLQRNTFCLHPGLHPGRE